MWAVKKTYFNVPIAVVVVYYVEYIILLYYFNVLNVKIKYLMFGVL